MDVLPASFAANLADKVYLLTKQPSKEAAYRELKVYYGESLIFGDSTLLTAKTGGPPGFKVSTGFGFVLIGKTPALKGHAFIVFRGTQLLADWVTNGNVSTTRSESTHQVHAGFYKSFDSMKPRLKDFLAGICKANSGIHTVHCVGHSLGGALATLCASWINSRISTYLYTFGSPRVGLSAFATDLTTRLDNKRIFRVYRRTDPVPMIPVWPYTHTPTSGTDYFMPSDGIAISFAAHSMPGYVLKIAKNDWKALEAFNDGKKSDLSIANWLESKSIISFNADSIRWLEDALVYVLRKCLGSMNFTAEVFLNGTDTLLDRLAYLLAKGVNIVEGVSRWVLLFIKKVMEAIGMKPVSDVLALSTQFIRMVLGRLQTMLYSIVHKALMYQL